MNPLLFFFFSFNLIRKALDRVRADFHSDTESGNHSDVFSSLALNAGVLGVSSPGDHSPVDSAGSSSNNVTLHHVI